MFKHGAKAASGFFDNGVKLLGGAKTARTTSRVRGVGRAISNHKKMAVGGAAIGLGAAGLMGRSGRAADKPNGRPTGPYMY